MRSALTSLLFLFLISNNIFAQFSYTSGDFASANDSFLVSTVPIFELFNKDFHRTDTNYTWNYGNLSPNNQRIVEFISPSRTGFQAPYILACTYNCYNDCYANCVNGGGLSFICQGYCTSSCGVSCLQNWNSDFNLAELVNDSLDLGVVVLTDVYNLYKKSSGKLEQNALGIKISNIPLVVPLSSPDVVYSFPMDQGDTSISNSSYSIKLDSIPGTGINFGFEYKHAQTRMNVVDGWGDLTTPYGYFPNVIKMKSVIANKDSITIAGNTVTLSDFVPSQYRPDTVIEYKWFDKNTGIPVLEATAWRVNGNDIYQNAEFTDTVRCFNPLTLFGYLPIPATLENGSDSAEVNFYSLSYNVDAFYWDFNDGNSLNNTSTQQNPTHYFTAPGLYNVTLRGCNTACPAGWCESLTIPVIVLDNRTEEPDTTSIADLKSIGVNVYPNPAYNNLYIDLPSDYTGHYHMDLTSVSGQHTLSQVVHGDNRQVDVSALPTGVYILTLDDGEKQYIQRISIVR